MNIRRLARDGVLTAVALTIFMVELQIPSLVPVPGVKLGLANIVTVAAFFLFGPWDAGAILLSRILLGAVFAGNLMALLYSLAGGVMCYLMMLVLRHVVTERQLWVCGVFGAVAHNIGQIGAAILVTGTPALLGYLPALMIAGILTGLFTGFAAQFVTQRLGRIIK